MRVEFSAEGTWSIQSGTKGTLFGMRWNVCSIRLTIIRGRQSARQIFDERRFFGCIWIAIRRASGVSGCCLSRGAMMQIADGQRLRIRRTQVLLVGSVKSKLYFHTNLHTYWPAIFQGRIEAPLFHGLHGLGIQTEAQSMDHSNVARMTGCVDNQP
jgi:hypothetical protein